MSTKPKQDAAQNAASNETLEELIVNRLANNFSNEALSKKIDNAIERSINDTIESLFMFGDGRDAIKNKIKEVMIPAINRVDLEDVNVHLDILLQRLIAESSIESRRKLLTNFSILMQEPQASYINASDLLNIYGNFVAEEIDNAEREVDYESQTYMPVTCTCTLELESTHYYSSFEHATLHFAIDESETQSNCEHLNIDVDVYRYKNERWHPKDQPEGCWSLSEEILLSVTPLRYADPFRIQLAKLKNAVIPIYFDLDNSNDYIEVEPTATPEWELV